MTLEKRGIPTVFFCPESFRGIVEAQAQLSGMPAYRPVTFPGQIAALTPQQAVAKVDLVAPRIVAGLLKG